MDIKLKPCALFVHKGVTFGLSTYVPFNITHKLYTNINRDFKIKILPFKNKTSSSIDNV